MKIEAKLSETQLGLIQEYIEDGVMAAIRVLWSRADGDVSESKKVLYVLTKCCSQPSLDFLETVCIQYDPRPSYLKSESLDPVDFFLDKEESKLDTIRFSIFKKDQKALDNCKIINGLMSINRAYHSKKHYFMQAISDPRLNTQPKALSKEQWSENQCELAGEMIKQAILDWVESQATQGPATPTITPKTEHIQTNGC
jgi:hypothetical protein